MSKKQELKRIDVHSDYVMFNAVCTARGTITLLFSIFQEDTKYGQSYEDCYKELTKLQKQLKKAEDALARREKSDGKNECQ